MMIFKGFYHICAWEPSWSCDPTRLYKFSFPLIHKLSYEIWFKITKQFLRKTSFNFESEWPLTKVKWCDQIWPWSKIGQRQHRVIIWTILVVLAYTMLYTRFQGHRSIGSGEDILRFLPYMGIVAILIMWPRPSEQLFVPQGPGGCIWNLVAISPVVLEKKMFEIVDGRGTDGRGSLSILGYTTLCRTTLRLLNNFVEKAFCRIVILSNFHLVETVFRRILSTKYSMLTRRLIVSADHLDWEATDTGEGYQSEADCCFYEGARGGNERVKQWFIENNWYGHILF